MTTETAMQIGIKRISDLGHKEKDCYIHIRHFVLSPMEKRVIPQGLQFFVLAEEVQNLRIESEIGVYDLLGDSANELQYVFEGSMELTNYSANPLHVIMIQVIFKHQ